MPTIGKPNIQNNFSGIKMAEKDISHNNRKKEKGNILNEMSGNNNSNAGVEFVDRKNHNKLGKNEFMKLLAYQLSNQDPLNPMDQKKFASELAQFSSLEQLSNINTKLKSINKNSPSEGKFYGASFLGKQLMTNGTTLKYNGRGDINIPFSLSKRAKNLMVRVFDKSGQMVSQINRENVGLGSQNISWDGIKQDETRARQGVYRFEVFAWDKNLTPFRGDTKSTGTITAVSFKNGETSFEVDGEKTVYLRDVERFKLINSGDNPQDRNIEMKSINKNESSNNSYKRDALKIYDTISE